MRKLSSREITSAFVELSENEICFLYIQLLDSNVRLPKMHKIPSDADFIFEVSCKIRQHERQTEKREIMKKEMKWREKSKGSEATLTVCLKHEDDYGMNGDSNLSHLSLSVPCT